MKAKDILTKNIKTLENNAHRRTCNERGPASHALCTSSIPSSKLGASQLNSCKAQGLRPRSGKISYVIDGKRVKMAGKKIKGKNYGGPLPKWSEDMDVSEDGGSSDDEEPDTRAYYTIGDIHAIGLSHAAKWSGRASEGALSSNNGLKSAIDSIPSGSVVVISLGQNDVRSDTPMPQIVSNINSLISYSKQRGQLPVYLLFPSFSDEKSSQLRDLLKQHLNCNIFDLEGGQAETDNIRLSNDAYQTVASKILSNVRPIVSSAAATTTMVTSNGPTVSRAKSMAEQYLGRTMSNMEWEELVKATGAEASPNTKEQAFVMGVILNRVRSGKWGPSIHSVLHAKNQFQAVTGAGGSGPSPAYTNGPTNTRYMSIIDSTKLLSSVPKNIINFTAASDKAYTRGTNKSWKTTLLNRNGFQIGGTIFSA